MTDIHQCFHCFRACYHAVAVARSSSGGNAIRYVLPVLWMTSTFHIMGRIAYFNTEAESGGYTTDLLLSAFPTLTCINLCSQLGIHIDAAKDHHRAI